jgi:hypothetical protein
MGNDYTCGRDRIPVGVMEVTQVPGEVRIIANGDGTDNAKKGETHMKLMLLGAAMLALMAFPVYAVPPAHNANAAVTIEASANPSAVGEAVTFTVTGLDARANVVYTLGVDGVQYELAPVDGVATVDHTFTAPGEYFLIVFQQRNGKQVLNLAYGSQVVN